MLRLMRIITDGAVRDVLVEEGSAEASLAGRYWNAKTRVLEGDVKALEPFVGKTVAGFPLETDPDVIESLGTIGEIDDEGPYGD